mgnify:CR=1 FL=1
MENAMPSDVKCWWCGQALDHSLHRLVTVTIVEHPRGFLMRLEHDGSSMTLDRAEAFDLHKKLSTKLGYEKH